MLSHGVAEEDLSTFFESQMEWLDDKTTKYARDLRYRVEPDDDEKGHVFGNTMDIVFCHNDLV